MSKKYKLDDYVSKGDMSVAVAESLLGGGIITIGLVNDSITQGIVGSAFLISGAISYAISDLRAYHKAKLDYMNDNLENKNNKLDLRAYHKAKLDYMNDNLENKNNNLEKS